MPNPLGENLNSLIGNPCLFPFDLDVRSGEVIFVPTGRVKLSSASFLDGREPFVTLQGEKKHSLKDLVPFFENQSAQQKPWNIIFHTGFCGSTLLARCLDQEGVCLSIKEPKILNTLSQTRHFGVKENEIKARQKNLKLCLNLLSRNFSTGEKIIIKPSNVDIILLEDVLALNPNSKIALIFSDLTTFLISVAKGGQPRRDFVRKLLAHLLADLKTENQDISKIIGISEKTLWKLSDLHIAAAVWHLQMHYLSQASGKNIYWLNCEDFFAKPARTVEKLKNFFYLGDNTQNRNFGELQQILSQHAKAPNFSYSVAKRKIDFIALENYLSPVLPEILSWAEEVFPERKKNEPHKIAV